MSAHLARLVDADLVAVSAQGRHRYYRLAGHDVAELLESLMGVAFRTGAVRLRSSPREPALRHARTCYDHLAGKVGVLMTEGCVARGYLRRGDDAFELTARGAAFFTSLGIDHEGARRLRRGFARVCIDWTERRPHLAGALGAALASTALERGWFERLPGTRALFVTPEGERAVRELFAAAE